MADDRDVLLKLDAARLTQRSLVDVVRTAYEEAGLSGLCEEGRLEVALGVMKEYDVRRLFPEYGRNGHLTIADHSPKLESDPQL